jgi:hypothetical protein
MSTVVEEVQQAQKGLLPSAEADLQRYAGQWVAVRDNVVVASDSLPQRLRENPAVAPKDTLVLVGSNLAAYLVV